MFSFLFYFSVLRVPHVAVAALLQLHATAATELQQCEYLTYILRCRLLHACLLLFFYFYFYLFMLTYYESLTYLRSCKLLPECLYARKLYSFFKKKIKFFFMGCSHTALRQLFVFFKKNKKFQGATCMPSCAQTIHTQRTCKKSPCSR